MENDKKMAPMSNGFKSRKLWYAVGTSLAVVACAVGAAIWPAFGVNLGEIIGGLLGALAIYNGTNVGSKFIQGRQASVVQNGYQPQYQAFGPPNVQPIEEIEDFRGV
jgi:hypothetical protein